MEVTLTRYQQGGYLCGDIVKIKKNALKHKKLEGYSEQFLAELGGMIKAGTQLKVSAVKSERPATTEMYGLANAVTGYWVDLVEEYAPGLWKNPMTLPMDILERVDVGNNRDPMTNPERKSKSTKPEKPEKSDREDVNRAKISDKNEKLEHTPEPKDGKDQTKKPKEYKANESTEPVTMDSLIDETLRD